MLGLCPSIQGFFFLGGGLLYILSCTNFGCLGLGATNFWSKIRLDPFLRMGAAKGSLATIVLSPILPHSPPYAKSILYRIE